MKEFFRTLFFIDYVYFTPKNYIKFTLPDGNFPSEHYFYQHFLHVQTTHLFVHTLKTLVNGHLTLATLARSRLNHFLQSIKAHLDRKPNHY